MDDAREPELGGTRQAAESVLNTLLRDGLPTTDRHRELCLLMIEATVADAVAEVSKEWDERLRLQGYNYTILAQKNGQQAEAIARLTTDLAGAEATNALLDEEVARLRAELLRRAPTEPTPGGQQAREGA